MIESEKDLFRPPSPDMVGSLSICRFRSAVLCCGPDGDVQNVQYASSRTNRLMEYNPKKYVSCKIGVSYQVCTREKKTQ